MNQRFDPFYSIHRVNGVFRIYKRGLAYGGCRMSLGKYLPGSYKSIAEAGKVIESVICHLNKTKP